MKRRADLVRPQINPMNPAFYASIQEKFTTNNLPAVYQNFDNRETMLKFLRHRNCEFHVNREVIGPCPVADALALKLADAGAHKDMVNGYLRHAGAGGPGGQISEAREVPLAGKGLGHA